MLQLYVENQPLDLPLDVAIRLQLKNPMFNEIGSYSLPFDIPLTSLRNEKFFKFPGRIQNIMHINRDYNFRIDYNYEPLFSGVLTIRNCINKSLSSYLKIDYSSFNSRIKDVKLNSIDYGGIRNIASSIWDVTLYYNSLINKYYPETDYNLFPVRNDNILFDTPFVNQANGTNLFFPPVQSFQGNVFTPFPFLVYVLDKIADYAGQSISNSIFYSDPDLKKLVIYNTFLQTNIYQITQLAPKTSIDIRNNIPDVLINDFINGLRTKFNVTFFPDRFKNNVNILKNVDIIKDPSFTDMTKKMINYHEIEFEPFINGYKLSSIQDRHDSFIEDHIIDIDFSCYNVKPSVFSINNLPLSGNNIMDLRLVTSVNQYYVWREDYLSGTTQWYYLTDNYLPYKYGDESHEVESCFSSPLMRNLEMGQYPGHVWRVPNVIQKGNSDVIFDNESNLYRDNPYSLRLLLYHGLQAATNGYYPYGSNDVYDYFVNKIPSANLSLSYHGDYGLHKHFWNDYLYWYFNIKKKCVARLLPDISFLRSFEYFRKIRLNSVNYLIDGIDTTIRNNSIDPVEISLFKV